MSNNTESTPQSSQACTNVTGTLICGQRGPPPMSPEFSSLMSLRSTLSPIFTGIEMTTLSIGLIGNILIAVILLSDKRLRSMAHAFLVNVALGDVMYTLLNLVAETLVLALDKETLAKTYCIVFRPLLAVRFIAYAISVFCLALLSVERCYAISSPIDYFSNVSFKKKFKAAILAIVWMVAIGMSAPLGFCSVGVEKPYIIFLAIALHAIPLTTITIANIKIIISLKKKGVYEIRPVNETARESLFKLLVLLIVSFILFWSPYHIFFLYHSFNGPPSTPERSVKWDIVLRAGNALTYFNPALNGILYFVFCRDFRTSLRSLFRKS